MEIQIRKIKETDLEWVREIFVNNWGGDFIVSKGKIYKYNSLDGFIAEEKAEKVGLITINTENGETEIITINSLLKERGIGSLLLGATVNAAKEKKSKRIWLYTTNDNLNALRFYQKNGFRLVRINAGAIAESRKLKQQIPEFGEDGIPIRDEIELEMMLTNQ
jgi:ribosomal protein S18 acetylase RimI-like enzyme